MGLFIEMFQETPWWVYLVFVFLILFSLRSILKKRRVHTIQYVLILPSTLGILNFFWLGERLQLHLYPLIYWVLGIISGFFFGWLMATKWVVQFDHDHSLIILPRTPSTLILLILFFVIRYFFIYNYEIHPEAFSHLFIGDALTSGTMTGLFVGRAIQIYMKYKKHYNSLPR